MMFYTTEGLLLNILHLTRDHVKYIIGRGLLNVIVIRIDLCIPVYAYIISI